jgi:hypothetical protein
MHAIPACLGEYDHVDKTRLELTPTLLFNSMKQADHTHYTDT